MKFVPLSEYMSDGRPLLLTNLEKAARNVSVDKSIQSSRWMALVDIQMKRQM